MLYTVDPKKIILTFGVTPIAGFADGTFVDIERNEDMFSEVIGADGEVTRVKSNNRTGTATFTLLQTSPSNDKLTAYALVDEQTGLGVQPFGASDLLGTTAVFSAMGYIKRIAKVEESKSATNREWKIFLTDLSIFVGGNTPHL
jgi:hypothetical protein